jgi:hypothetical protein
MLLTKLVLVMEMPSGKGLDFGLSESMRLGTIPITARTIGTTIAINHQYLF